jgi:high-affinity iron transporter
LTPRILILLIAALLSLGLVSAGCGDDSNDTDDAAEEAEEAEETALTPDEAIGEIALVRKGIDEGLTAYEAGDAATAETLVGDAYLEHFELVEPPLEDADEELNEELEVLIRETLTGAIAAGEPVKDVEKLVDEVNSGLDEAEAALSGSGGASG